MSSCALCAQWFEQASRVTRMMRLSAETPPDLTDRIIADVTAPGARVLRRRVVLRMVLGALALVQVGISVPSAFGESLGMTMTTHGMHEAAAWNIALGLAFVATAFAPRRAAGMLPLLGAFVVVLTALSVRDELDGAVGLDRLATHVVVVVALVVVWALDRTQRSLGSPEQSDFAVDSDQADDEQRGGGLRGVA